MPSNLPEQPALEQFVEQRRVRRMARALDEVFDAATDVFGDDIAAAVAEAKVGLRCIDTSTPLACNAMVYGAIATLMAAITTCHGETPTEEQPNE